MHVTMNPGLLSTLTRVLSHTRLTLNEMRELTIQSNSYKVKGSKNKIIKNHD